MKILITGSSGQLGSELKELFTPNNKNDFFFLDRNDLDLSNPEQIYAKLEHYQPNIIIHAAAFTAVDLAESESELANKVNYLSTLEIARFAGKYKVKLIYISTDYVFPGDIDQALDEEFPCDPINVYGQTKRNAELAVLQYAKNAIIIRTSWVYSIYGKNFVKTMLNLMANRPEINVVSDQIGTPTYAYDLAAFIKQIVEEDKWVAGIYHYSNEGRISWYDFAVAIRDLSGLNCQIHPILSANFPTAAKRPHFSLLSKEKIKNTFGIEIPNWKISLTHMLNRINQINN